MLDKLKNRYFIFAVAVLAMFIFMGAGLWRLTIVQGDENKAKSETTKLREITLKGERGRILDRNGLPLAYNQKSYDIQFYRNPSNRKTADTARYTEILMETIHIIEEGGGKTIDTFSIVRGVDGVFRFKWGDISAEAATAREKNWRKNMFVDEKSTPEEIYLSLRRSYQIPPELSYEEAFKLLSIWQEVTQNLYIAYMPVKIAYNVPMETVAKLELKTIELEGISVTEGNVRIYPQGALAAHIIGYLGRISEEDGLEAHEEKGYGRDDLIGKTGVEQSMEAYLTGNTKEHAGKELVEINNQAKVMRTLERQAPSDGFDVMLTIDLYLQKVVETALENNIKHIRQLQEQELLTNPDKYNKSGLKAIDKIRLAEFGAAVVMDIKNGDVLAMASYPSFDLNEFSGGISKEVLYELAESEEALRTTPLFNKAIKSKAAPGSIFKMVTALAGLEEGVITPETRISDESPFTEYITGFRKGVDKPPSDAPSCWTKRPSDHAHINVEEALKVSCNYFFSSVAYQLKIERLNKWANKLGLDSLTNIELSGEARGQIGGQSVIFDREKPLSEQRISRPRIIYNYIKERLNSYCTQLDLEADEDAIDRCARSLLLLVDPNDTEIGDRVRTIMSEELGIPKSVSQSRFWYQDITMRLTELRWTPAETVRTGFGQSIALVTPIAAARYLSSLVNGGHVFDAHVVRRVVDAEGKTLLNKDPVVFAELEADSVNMHEIILGMEDAVSPEDGGTAGTEFSGFDYKIGGKTGTAQVGTSKATNIDLENTSWFAAYAPRENPEIAIIIYIPYGWKGALSSDAVKDIVQFYMDRKMKQAPENIPAPNQPVMG